MLARNKVSYSLFNVSEVGPEQYSFHGLEQSEQEKFCEHIDESQSNITFKGTSLDDYNKQRKYKPHLAGYTVIMIHVSAYGKFNMIKEAKDYFGAW